MAISISQTISFTIMISFFELAIEMKRLHFHFILLSLPKFKPSEYPKSLKQLLFSTISN